MAPIAGSRIVDHITMVEKVGHWSHPLDTQVGHTECEIQTMLPLTIRGVCIFMCLAASMATLILSLFSLHFIMFKNVNTTHRQKNQERVTELEPLCLLAKSSEPAFLHYYSIFTSYLLKSCGGHVIKSQRSKRLLARRDTRITHHVHDH